MANEVRREEITDLLVDWRRGDEAALDRLTPLVYAELRRRAAVLLASERKGGTLQPTALVHEVYLRLVDAPRIDWESRAHFFAVAARIMRRILVDCARERRAAKRGGGIEIEPLEGDIEADAGPSVDLLAVDEALSRLGRLDPRQERIVELRYFAGLTVEETAVAIGASPATVKRDWETARAFLLRALGPAPRASPVPR